MTEEKILPEWKYQLQGFRGLNPPPVPKRPALLVIDMQRYFCDPAAPAYSLDFESAIEPCNTLIRKFEKLGFPVFFTQYYTRGEKDPTVRWWGASLDRDSEWVSLDTRLHVPKSATCLFKHTYGTFASTGLALELKELKCDSVVVCGVMTDLCCETTAREAFDRGFIVYFIGDATATSDPMLHFSALATLAHGFAFLLTAEEMLDLLEGKDG